MPKLVVNIGRIPLGFSSRQLEVQCSPDEASRFGKFLGEPVLIAATVREGGPPLLMATANLEQFISARAQTLAVLTDLRFQDFDIKLSRLLTKAVFEVLDDDMLAHFDFMSFAATPQLAEAAAIPFIGFDVYGEIARQVRETRGTKCSFSGIEVALGKGAATPIRPLDSGGEIHVRNFIFLHDEPAQMFNRFAWTVGPDWEIIVDAQAMGTSLMSTMNATGRLLVGDSPLATPDQAALAWHREQFLDQLR